MRVRNFIIFQMILTFFLIFLKLEGFKIGQGYSYQTQQEKGLPRPSSPRLTIVPYTALVVLRKLIPLSAVYGCSFLHPPNLTNQDLKKQQHLPSTFIKGHGIVVDLQCYQLISISSKFNKVFNNKTKREKQHSSLLHLH